MKKVLAKSYLCLIYVFFALFVLILRMDANEHTNIYSLGLILAAIFLSIIPFFTNHCKKIEARIVYLVSMILIGISVTFVCLSYLLVDIISVYDSLVLAMSWIIRISQALFITSTLFTIYYGIKDFFKKEYELQKFDFQVIQMIINLLTYIAFFYVLFDYGAPKITQSIGGFAGSIDDYYLKFYNFNVIRNAILIISACYIGLYVLLEIIKYKKFEKIEDNSNNIYK